MKLRLEENSLRLRLRRKEVEQLAKDGRVEVTLDFGGARLSYVLQAGSTSATAQAAFDGSVIQVSLPEALAQSWAASNEVAIEAVCGGLAILIEKDFQCLHKGPAENEDAYPNPAGYN